MNRTGRNEYFRKYIREDFPFEEFGRLTRDNFWKIVDKEGLPLKKVQKNCWHMESHKDIRWR